MWVYGEHQYTVINPVLLHHVAMPKTQQAGEICKMLGGSGGPQWIWTASTLQMCSLCLCGPSQLCVQELSKCYCAERWGCDALF